MRRVQIGDILALSGMIAGQSEGAEVALRMCSEAHAAHAFAKRTGRLHPRWGNGSLMSRVFAAGGRVQADWSGAGVAALGTACAALAYWRAERLDCRGLRPCARLASKHEESADGRNPAQTQQHRSGLGPRVP